MAGDGTSVADFYTVSGLGGQILQALERSGKDLQALVPRDLAPVDEFHIRGLAATEGLATLAAVENGAEVLDVGCGLGGSCRYLASEFGCYATGLDITEEYCQVAKMLSDRVGLAESTEFHCGSALEMPFPNASFDLVWTEHAQMNIRDKDLLYSEISRVLKRGGTFAFHDVFAGPGGTPRFPVPWAGKTDISFLMDPEELRLVLQWEDLRPRHWEDVTDESLRWFRDTLERARRDGRAPLGLHLLTGADGEQKFENLLRNLQDQTIVVIQAVMEKHPE